MGHLGVDSITAVQLVGAVEDRFGVEFGALDLASGPPIASLVEKIVARVDRQLGELVQAD